MFDFDNVADILPMRLTKQSYVFRCSLGFGVSKSDNTLFDKNNDGKVTPWEVGETTQEILTDGKVDSNKLFGKVAEK